MIREKENLNHGKNKMVAGVLLCLFLVPQICVAAGKGGPSPEHRAAFEECAAELGLSRPQEGERPPKLDEATRESLDACLNEKGFEPPAKFRGHRERPPQVDDEAAGVQ